MKFIAGTEGDKWWKSSGVWEISYMKEDEKD